MHSLKQEIVKSFSWWILSSCLFPFTVFRFFVTSPKFAVTRKHQWAVLKTITAVNIACMVAKMGNICFGSKICVRKANMFFCFKAKKTFSYFQATKFVSPTYASWAAKLGNICLRNNFSATMFPSLARLSAYLDYRCYVQSITKQRCLINPEGSS